MGCNNIMQGKYNDYLKSQHWMMLRNSRKEIDGYKCVVCGCEQNLDVHHLTYKSIGSESIDDVITLCHECHAFVHNLKQLLQECCDVSERLKIESPLESFHLKYRKLFVKEVWKRNLFSQKEYLSFIKNSLDVVKLCITKDQLTLLGKLNPVITVVDYLALVKDCFIENNNPQFDISKRKYKVSKKTKYK